MSDDNIAQKKMKGRWKLHRSNL